jgi:hypothetical protein
MPYIHAFQGQASLLRKEGAVCSDLPAGPLDEALPLQGEVLFGLGNFPIAASYPVNDCSALDLKDA